MVGALGLNFPVLESQSQRENKFITEPIITNSNSSKAAKEKEHGLYSYLERDFLQKRNMELTESSMIDYAKNPANKKFHRLVLEKSRKFLKDNVEKNNYRFIG